MATATETKPRTRADRTIIGIVSSAKTPKTLKVEVKYQTKHPKYGKYLKRTSVYHVHDEQGEGHRGRHGRDRRVPAVQPHQAPPAD